MFIYVAERFTYEALCFLQRYTVRVHVPSSPWDDGDEKHKSEAVSLYVSCESESLHDISQSTFLYFEAGGIFLRLVRFIVLIGVWHACFKLFQFYELTITGFVLFFDGKIEQEQISPPFHTRGRRRYDNHVINRTLAPGLNVNFHGIPPTLRRTRNLRANPTNTVATHGHHSLLRLKHTSPPSTCIPAHTAGPEVPRS